IESIDPADTRFSGGIMVKFAPPPVMDLLAVLGPCQFPRVAAAQPVIRFLDLSAMFDPLAEHPVFIPYAVPGYRKLECGAAVQEAGSKPAQTAVSQSRIRFRFDQIFKLEPYRVQGSANVFGNTQAQGGISKGASHKEFQGEIIGAFAVTLLVGVAG